MATTFSVELTPESERLLTQFEKEFGADALNVQLDKFFARESNLAAGHIIKNFLSGQALARRSGALARSIVGKAERFDGIPGMRVGVFRGPALIYAGIQEFGTKGLEGDSPFDTIKPTKAKALAFPPEGSPALTGAGVNRFASPRDFPESLRFIPFRKGVVVGGLFEEARLKLEQSRLAPGETIDLSKLQVVYLLISQLDLPAREYLKRGMLDFLPQVASDLATFLAGIVGGES